MNGETRLQRLANNLQPPPGARDRVRASLSRRLAPPEALGVVRESLEPTASAQERVWDRIRQAIAPARAVLWLERVRDFLTPQSGLASAVWRGVTPRFAAAPARSWTHRAATWTAAVAVVSLAVRISPLFFLASPTIAEGAVLLVPTRGEIFVSVGGLWQPVEGEILLKEGMALRTDDGEATIVLRDSGVIRMDRGTSLTLLDLSGRMAPAPEIVPTLTLHDGRLWIQGLLPASLRGFTVATSQALVTVHEGSVSVTEGEVVDVEVHNRRARVQRRGEETLLVGGERIQMWSGSVPQVRAVDDTDDPWVAQNIARDAVHRRDIAQMQQERRAARAGILPTSRLYPVKRVAEAAELLMTLDPQARVEKQIAYATTRLDEAAALLQEGGATEDVAIPLAEYRKTLLALAGSGGATAQFLLQQAMAEATAENAALLPGDESYVLKKSVLEATAALPEGQLTPADVHGELLVDTLAALNHAADGADADDLAATWNELQPHLAFLDAADGGTGSLAPDVVKEARGLLEQFALAVAADEELDEEFVSDVTEYLPAPAVAAEPQMTDAEVEEKVLRIIDRVFSLKMPRSRSNELQNALRGLRGHPEEGRILRALYRELPPDTELLTWVRQAIARLRVQQVQ